MRFVSDKLVLVMFSSIANTDNRFFFFFNLKDLQLGVRICFNVLVMRTCWRET